MKEKLKPYEVKKLQVAMKDGDPQLTLHVAELSKLFPDFTEAMRIYWIINFKLHPAKRASHYHPEKAEILFVLSGEVTFKLKTSLGEETITIREDSDECIIIRPNVHHELITSSGSIVLVACPAHFDPEEAQDDNKYLEYKWE